MFFVRNKIKKSLFLFYEDVFPKTFSTLAINESEQCHIVNYYFIKPIIMR